MEAWVWEWQVDGIRRGQQRSHRRGETMSNHGVNGERRGGAVGRRSRAQPVPRGQWEVMGSHGIIAGESRADWKGGSAGTETGGQDAGWKEGRPPLWPLHGGSLAR